MTTLQTALNGAATISASTAPALGYINSYNAGSGALTPTLPALSGCNVGAYMLIEKNIADGTFNSVTFTASGTDTFDDLSTSVVLFQPYEKRTLQVISISGTKYWKVTSVNVMPTALASNSTQFSLSASTTATTIITATLPAAVLQKGSVFRITLNGTIQNTTTSGALTFTPYIQNTALNTGVMASASSTNAASGFWSQTDITVRTVGASGTAIAKTFGIANLATTGLVGIASSTTTTTTINTTTSATNTLYIQAAWTTNNASNILLVEQATIERVL